jgi:hypothetical protein
MILGELNEQIKKEVENFKDLKIIARELQSESIAQEQELQPTSIAQMQPISPNFSDPKVGDKRPRGDLQEVDGSGDNKNKIPLRNPIELSKATRVQNDTITSGRV